MTDHQLRAHFQIFKQHLVTPIEALFKKFSNLTLLINV
ncbi:Hypothetical protein ADU72_1572 [Pediococcus damnosus]|uniref:Transposase n=1 Tax=Pediococcus damnosus TaxID=51663 RepID=A0ABN4NAF8_9LACO|nr:Hypothetical protein ADU72_1572 [Pediococcus damnosus]